MQIRRVTEQGNELLTWRESLSGRPRILLCHLPPSPSLALHSAVLFLLIAGSWPRLLPFLLLTLSLWDLSSQVCTSPSRKEPREAPNLVSYNSGPHFHWGGDILVYCSCFTTLQTFPLYSSPLSGSVARHFWDSWTKLECHRIPWCNQSTPCASLCQVFPSFWHQKLCLYFIHLRNIFKTALTGSNLQAPQGWGLQKLGLVQTQDTQGLSDEVWTQDISLALLVKLCASKGQEFEELQSQSPITALPDSGDLELARN